MPRPGKRITPHEERVVAAIRKARKPITSLEVAKLAKVAPRTARQKLQEMDKAGKVETLATWPALTYRWVGALIVAMLCATGASAEWSMSDAVDPITDERITMARTESEGGDRLVIACLGDGRRDLKLWMSAESFAPAASVRKAGGSAVGIEVRAIMRVDDEKPKSLGFDVDSSTPMVLGFPASRLTGKSDGWLKRIVGHERVLLRVEALHRGAVDVEFYVSGLDVSALHCR